LLNVFLAEIQATAAADAALKLAIASNLSDLASASTARTNLGLGNSATRAVGTTAGTVAAGDDSRLSDTRTPTDNSVTSAKIVNGAILNEDINASAGIVLSKLAVDPLARANHTGTQLAATVSDFNTAVATTAALKANNLSDLANAGTARTNLSLGGAALLAVGTGSGDVAAGDRPAIVQGLVTATEWTASTAYAVGQFITHYGVTYRVTAGFTSGGSFALTNLTCVGSSITGSPIVAGNYMWPGVNSGSNTSSTLGVGTMRAHLWYLPHPVTLTRIGAEVSTVGEAGSKVRLGIYSDNGEFSPDALIVDAGVIAGDSATVQELTINQALNPGHYWLTGTVQVVTTTQPTLRTGNVGQVPIVSSTIPGAAQGNAGLAITGVTGALPGTFGTPTQSGTPPKIFVKG
jgi:hypothetical protein